MEIQFRKPSMKYKAGQWLFINIPSVSQHQWHPFTITSCPYDPYVSIHVRQVGDWSKAVGDALGAGPSQEKQFDDLDPMGMYEIALANGQKMPGIKIDGPYGAPAEDVFDNEIAVLIGTGIGVTPWASILKNIWHLRNSPNPPRRLRRVEFIWVCKDTTSFEWFQTLLSSLEAQSNEAASIPGREGPEFLRIHTYLTQRVNPDMLQNIVLHSVGAAKDPLTELKSRTNFGRPDFTKLMAAMRDGILDQTYIGGLEGMIKTNVGVYFCGPNTAARDIKYACKQATCEEVNFSFWKEQYVLFILLPSASWCFRCVGWAVLTRYLQFLKESLRRLAGKVVVDVDVHWRHLLGRDWIYSRDDIMLERFPSFLFPSGVW